MSQLTWKRSALFLALAILLDLSGLRSASAQTAMSVNNNESTPMPGVGHDYVHFLSETVDPRNGSLSVQIQFPVPPSRGVSIPFSINYDSNGIFHMLATNPPGGVYAATDKAYLSENGWSYSAPLLSYYETFNSAKWKVQFGVQLYSTCYDLTDFIFTDPSGGRHSFYLSYLLPNQSDSSYCDQTTTPTKTFLSDTSDESGEYQAYLSMIVSTGF